MGPVPNPDGLVAPVPKAFAASYDDLKKAHVKAASPVIVLVDDPAHADAILTITYRGEVDSDPTVKTGARMSASSVTLTGTHRPTPTLLARLTVRASGAGADFSGVSTDPSEQTKWSTQASRIYTQAAAWMGAMQDQLIKLRQ